MEIRHRLTLQFTILVAFLLLAILGFNYFLAYIFASESFLDRLKERAVTVATMHLDQDKPHQKQFDEINKRYKQVLRGETIQIFDTNLRVCYSEQTDSFKPDPELIAVVRSGEYEASLENGRYVIGFTYNLDDQDYYIFASAVDATGTSKLQNMLKTMLISFLVFLVFVVLAGQFLSQKALEPIQSVIQQVNSITAESLDKRVKYKNDTDEIAQLALTFNSMLVRLENSFKSQSGFVRNASHELRNPLAAMIGQAEIALNRDRDNPYYKDVIKAIFEEALRLKHIVNSLLELSQASPEVVASNQEIIRLDELILDIVESLVKTKNYKQIEVRLPDSLEAEPLIVGNRSLLEVAIGNLIENACKYSDGKLVHCFLDQLDNTLQLSIKDEGIGMTEEDIAFFTEPFYRSSRARMKEGFGIGMAISSKILQIHGIEMDVKSRLEMGTTVTLRFNPVQLPASQA
ncbi:MAG TPA: HAMP domain-containing sensor histidine kinase [Catalimonadaceae bacterium]|nr:HAMP domain-containing sensor histidine kinase [Catalimonadaceae bacterium]HPI10595.1 HAMP domain-containing sensor histidine kinase [Catalimonadaceae bacterium]